MSKTPNPRALDRDEALMVEQSKTLSDHGPAELRDLIGRLRARRDRVQRQIRTRVRDGRDGPDTGAREKKALLTEAIARVADEMAARKDGRAATANLRKAVARKADTPRWTGPEDRTADTGPAETPNTKIAPSGALHAEGMRAAIARSTGAR
ncbi:hypothetical protein [Brevundimonas sp. Marseille-Q4549]